MLRLCMVLSLSLVANAGCKSSNVIRLRDRTVQKYDPTIPESGVAASSSLNANESSTRSDAMAECCSSGTGRHRTGEAIAASIEIVRIDRRTGQQSYNPEPASRPGISEQGR